MKCTFSELRDREVISTSSGTRIGYIDDMEIDTESGKIKSLIICGRPRMMGLLGRGHSDTLLGHRKNRHRYGAGVGKGR